MAETTDELLDQLRSQLDETNTINATDSELLQALNRAQRKATNIATRVYDSLFWNSVEIPTVLGTRDYDIPDRAYGRKIEMVECFETTEVNWELKRINNHKRSRYVTASQTSRPFYYTLKKNTIQIYPLPAGNLTLRFHYSETPEKLVLNQGRITSISSGFVLVDTVGSDLSTTTTGFNSYVNFIDYISGEVKGSAQIVSLKEDSTTQIKFKSSGLTRTTVLGKTIGTSIPSTVEVDDYVCVISGTCIPELPEAYTDYVIARAVIEIRVRFGEDVNADLVLLRDQEEELKKMWAGRESSNRVRKSSNHWKRILI